MDWLTCTSPDVSDTSSLATLGNALVGQEAQAGNGVVTRSFRGYTGSQSGRAFGGLGPQGALLRLSGDLADLAFKEGTAVASHISRLDLAATVRLEFRHDAYEAERWDEYQHWILSHGGIHAGEYRQDVRGSATTYIGSRTSEAYLRIYNKEGECAARHDRDGLVHYVNCHRFELEVKNRRACATAAALGQAENRAPLILGWIAGFCQARGITTTGLTADSLRLEPGLRRRSDSDVQLGWLQSQVRPTLKKLIAQGHADDVTRILAL